MDEPERYEFAEPDGGCFIPRHGDRPTAMARLQQAASWYGAKVVPAGGDRPVTVKLTMTQTPEMMAALARAAREIKRRYPRPGDLGLS